MKRIIQHGNSSKMAIYVRKCPCGCQFEYGAADVDETFFDPRDRVTMWYEDLKRRTPQPVDLYLKIDEKLKEYERGKAATHTADAPLQ